MDQICMTMMNRLFWSHAILEFDYWLRHLAAVWYWASDSVSLNLSFICKTGKIMVPSHKCS